MLESAGEVIVLTTVGKSEQAEALAASIVEKRLAACVTVISGGLSFFRWKGQNVKETELVLLIKTHRDKLSELQSHFEREHPYEVPEFVVLDVAGLSESYGKWMHEELELKSKGDA